MLAICENVKVDTIYDLSWRAYPVAVIALGGAVVLYRGLRLGRAGLGDPPRNLRFVRGFRLAVIGLALIAFAAAWLWQQQWLLILALVIGGEETLESSIHAWAIRRGIELEARKTALSSTA